MPGGGDEKVTRHRPVLLTATEHLACLDEQVTGAMVFQAHALNGTRFGDDDLACGMGLFQGDKLHWWGGGLLPAGRPATGQLDEVNGEVSDSDGVKDGHAERRGRGFMHADLTRKKVEKTEAGQVPSGTSGQSWIYYPV